MQFLIITTDTSASKEQSHRFLRYWYTDFATVDKFHRNTSQSAQLFIAGKIYGVNTELLGFRAEPNRL